QIRAGIVETSPYVTASMREWEAPYTRQLEQIKENARAEEDAAKERALGAIKSGKAFEELFEKRKAEPLAQAIEEIVGRIQSLKATAGNLLVGGDLQSYSAVNKLIENQERQLRSIIQLDKERTEFRRVYHDGLD